MEHQGENGKAEQEDTGDMLELFSDYYEGGLSDADRARVEKKLAEDADYKHAYEDFEKTMKALSGMHKMSAPQDFERSIEDTIHKRSGGRFFGRRAFGDRIPYEVLAIVVILLGLGLYWIGRSSDTGGYKLEDKAESPIPEDAKDLLPRP